MNSFLAKSKKALGGGITAAAVGLTATLTPALSDGVITTDELWKVATLTLGGFVLGFAGVWATPANATDVVPEGDDELPDPEPDESEAGDI